MGRITIFLDAETESILKARVDGSGQSASRWIAEAIHKRAQEAWPTDVLALFGSWKDDEFPDADALRNGYGADVRRKKI